MSFIKYGFPNSLLRCFFQSHQSPRPCCRCESEQGCGHVSLDTDELLCSVVRRAVSQAHLAQSGPSWLPHAHYPQLWQPHRSPGQWAWDSGHVTSWEARGEEEVESLLAEPRRGPMRLILAVAVSSWPTFLHLFMILLFKYASLNCIV